MSRVMSCATVFACASFVVAALPQIAHAQSAIVDLSKPQTGKSQYVFGTDLKPADLGGARVEAKPGDPGWCANGCKMDQPQLAAAQAAQQRQTEERRSGGNRVIVIGNTRNVAPQAMAAADKPKSSGFRIRFGRRR